MNTNTLDAIDKLLQCAATDFAGMNYSAMKDTATNAARAINEASAAFVRLEQKKEELLDSPLPLDGEVE